MSPAIEARLRNLHIELAAEAKGHCLFIRDDVFALAVRAGAGFGSIGSTGMVTGSGLAYLTWRNGRAMLAAKGSETPAQPEETERIRRFSEELKAALLSPEG